MPLFFLSFLFLSAFSYADDYPVQPYFIFDSFSYSETVSIKSTIKDSWKNSDFESGERQWTWNWLEVGVQYKNWGIGYIKRYDYDMRFSEQTAEFFWLTKNKKDLPIGKKYSLDLQANAIHSSGLRVSYSDSFMESFDYQIGLSYLQATYSLDGKIKGDATATSDSDYDFDATVDYAYTEDHLFERNVQEPEGQGFSLDFMFNYQVTAEVYWQLQVRDLFARLYWENSPYTEGHATSDRKEYDENGYVSFNPVLQGYEGTRDVYVQTLEPRWYSKVGYDLNRSNAITGQVRYQYGHALYSIGVDHVLTLNSRLGINYWPINRSVELNWNYYKVKLAVSTDALSVSDMKTFWLSFSYGL
jgi:hypothetical protein